MDGEGASSSEGGPAGSARRGRSAGRRAVPLASGPNVETLRDEAPQRERFLEDVLAGLRRRPPELPSKYLYDELGSQLFEQICELDVYYPTRTELSILQKYAGEIAERAGPRCLLIEFGSGSSMKTRVLLRELERPAGYVPIDISREHLLRSALALARSYPQLAVLPVCGDYTQVREVPLPPTAIGRRLLFFPGSTIGNLDPLDAQALLRKMAHLVGPGGGLLIGVDLHKDPRVLELAYDDPQGVTAAFELNVLERINRELGASFDLSQWAYRARYDLPTRCVEMMAVSLRRQRVRIGGESFSFAAGAEIVTERSHKYSVEDFRALAEGAGVELRAVWTDPDELFSVQYFSVS